MGYAHPQLLVCRRELLQSNWCEALGRLLCKSIEEVSVPLLQGVEGGDTGDFSRGCTSGHGLLDAQAVRNVGMAGGLALLQGKLAILALHDLEFLIVRASRKLLLAAGALVKRHPTHGAGFQHGAESVH